MNNRVKELRQALGLTLEQFGANLGVTKTAISGMEHGRRNITNQMFLSICHEYNVNKSWLKDGTGSMFQASGSDEYLDAIQQLRNDPLVVASLIA